MDFARVYHIPKDNLVEDVLVQLLKGAVRVRRSTGDVRSTGLILYREALAEFLERNRIRGAIRWLSSNRLARKDIEAVRHCEAYVLPDVIQSLREGPGATGESAANWGPRVVASLLQEGLLEWKVVEMMTEGVYHEKVALFDDACGHRILLSGSWNESLAGYTKNGERVDVHRSLDDPERCRDATDWFERVWNGEAPGFKVADVREAIARDEVVEEEDERWPLPKEPRPELWTPELLFLAVQDKVLPDLRDPYVGTLVNPLPHQSHIHRRVLLRQPPRFLLADEVGLGKTIEAGMIVSTMAATGYARKILVLAPRNVLDQWHQELWEKFQLTSWKLENGRWVDEYGKRQLLASSELFDRLPGKEPHILLVSRSLAMRRERMKQFTKPTWDMVILDEAHKARGRKKGSRYEKSNLLDVLNALAERTTGLLLLTATPVQLDLSELYDLLQPLGLPKDWRQEPFRDFIRILGSDEPDWRYLLDLAAGSERFYRERFGLSEHQFDEDLASGVKFSKELPPDQDPERTFKRLLQVVRSRAYHEIASMSEGERRLLKIALYRMSPIYQLTCRTTRDLLRTYRDLGVIRQRVPDRRLEDPISVEFGPEESALYRDVRDRYLRPFYQAYSKAELSRNNVGFVLSVYAKRAASSWFGLRESLKRRLARVERALKDWDTGGIRELFGTMAVRDLASEGATESELETELEEFDEITETPLEGVDVRSIREIAERERSLLEELVRRLDDLSARGIDSKKNRVIREIPNIVARRRGLLVFSQFKDTVDDLADSLIPEYGSKLAKYYGGGGEIWDGTSWTTVDKATVEKMVKSNKFRVLVATDAASEGLNLQSLDALMNYDIPWNPMRIEQRIGRIDRLNQESPTVSVQVVVPRDTVEEEVYRRCVKRIEQFRESLGPLQPILIEEYVRKALLQGDDVGEAVDKAMEEWQTAHEHAKLLEKALASVLPTDEWHASREVEQRTLVSLVSSLGYNKQGACWVRDGSRLSVHEPAEGADILTAAPSNPVFGNLLSELGPIPAELRVGDAVFKLISGGSSRALAVKPSAGEGWYILKDLARLDGRAGIHVGMTEADVARYVSELEEKRSEECRSLWETQRIRRLEDWREEVKHKVLGPLIRLYPEDIDLAAKEIATREALAELWRAFRESSGEIRPEEIAQFLSNMKSEISLRGSKKNIGLIVGAAKILLRAKP